MRSFIEYLTTITFDKLQMLIKFYIQTILNINNDIFGSHIT